MCWEINKKKFYNKPEKYHRIAHEDIIIYKFGQVKKNKFYPCTYGNFIYKPNIATKKIKLRIRDNWYNHLYSIYDGYHCYNNKTIFSISFNVNDISKYGSGFCHIGEFIIPKETEFYENEYGEIVSSQLVWTGKYYHTINFKNKDYVLLATN